MIRHVILRALSKLGSSKHIPQIVPLLTSPEREVQVEAIKALSPLADESHAETIRGVLRMSKQADEATIINSADKALKELDDRFSMTVLEENKRAEKIAVNTKTLLVENEDLEKLLQAAKEQSKVGEIDGDGEVATAAAVAAPSTILDISTLEPGDVLEGRYKYIEKIGKGAFGTVLLMEDEVVDERLILKFLNPNVSSD